ncbi:MAG: phage tail tape measure protein [Acidimicrobiales bacterium]
MAGRSATVILDANVAPYVAGMGKATVATTGFAHSTQTQLTKTTANISKLGQSTGLLPGKFGALASVGGVAFAGLGLAAVTAVKRFNDFDVAMDGVAASTGATETELAQLGETALQAAADTKFGAVDAAQGIEALGKAGVATADIVGGGLKGALDLAAAGEVEVADAAELAAGAMTQFNLAGRDVPHIADLMAAAAGKAQGGVDDMALALKQSGLVASQMGLSIEETTGTLAAFASNALIGSDAGTSFRTMLLRLANPSGEARDLMESLGIEAYNAQGGFIGMESLAGQLQLRLAGLTQEQRDAALATIFGSDAIRGANVLYQQGAEGIKAWEDNVNDAGFAAEQAAQRTDNLSGDLERLFGELDKLLIQGGEAGAGPARGIVQGAESWIATLNEEIDLWKNRYLPTIEDVDRKIDEFIPDWLELGDVVGDGATNALEAAEAQEFLASELQRDEAIAGRYASSLEAAEVASAELTEQTEELKTAAFEAAEQFLTGRDNVRDWYAAVDEATASIDENGKTLDIASEAGRSNQEALDAMASAALRVLEDMDAAGEETDTASQQMRTALVNTGIRMGLTEQKAADYADEVIAAAALRINTPVKMDDTAARAKLAAWKKTVAAGGGTITFSIRAIEAAGTGGLGGFMTSGSRRLGGMPWLGNYPRTQGSHDGGALDYGVPGGTPLQATFSGYFDATNLGNRSYGMYYTLRGGGKYELAAHLSRFARGDGFVSAGTLLGWSGNTGNSDGYHVHLLRNFHKGGMLPHTGPFYGHGGEFVVNPSATSGNRALLEAINAGRSGGAIGPMRLHPTDIRAIGQVIASEMMTAVGAGSYAAGQRANLYARAG